jgi:hypothetical protein
VRRLGLVLSFLLALGTVAWAQSPPLGPTLGALGILSTQYPVARQHPFALGLMTLWRVLPGLDAGPRLYEPMSQLNGTLGGMGAGVGWQATTRQGGAGELRFDGTASVVTLGDLAVFDVPSPSFTVSLWFRTASAVATQYLIAKRLGAGGIGGWFLRISPTALTARILDAGNTPAAERTTVAANLADGAWHFVLVYFATDTVTPANNDVGIFIDGQVDQGTLTATGNPYAFCSGGCPLVLGMQSDGVSPLLGAMDDVRIYRRFVPAQEVAEQMRANRQGDPDFLPRVLPAGVLTGSTGSFAPFFQ